MRAVVRFIESVSEITGKAICWLAVILVITLSYEVIMRYIFDAPTIWAHDVATMLGGTIVALGWGYTHLHKGHVRIDIFYTRLTTRGKAILDAVCTLTMLFPLIIVFSYVSTDRFWTAWIRHEKLIESHWYPPAFPIRAIFLAGWILFGLQVIATFVRDVYYATRSKEYVTRT